MSFYIHRRVLPYPTTSRTWLASGVSTRSFYPVGSCWRYIPLASGIFCIGLSPYLCSTLSSVILPPIRALIQLLHRVDCSISNLSVHFLLSFLPIRAPSYILYRSHCSRTLIDFAAAVSLTLLYFAVANFNCSSCTCRSLSLLELTNYLHRCCNPVTWSYYQCAQWVDWIYYNANCKIQ